MPLKSNRPSFIAKREVFTDLAKERGWFPVKEVRASPYRFQIRIMRMCCVAFLCHDGCPTFYFFLSFT